MAEKKRYVVWKWTKTWIFEDRVEVQPLVSWVAWSKFKSFKSEQEAKEALEKGREEYYEPAKKWFQKDIPFEKKSIAVDAACSSATGVMEYQWIDLVDQKKVFSFSFPEWTNNIWEFLAIVHGLSRLKEREMNDYSLYSDSKTAMNRVVKKRCNSSYAIKDKKLLEIIKRAENRLENNTYTTKILKRNTETRGEIPADFWRK